MTALYVPLCADALLGVGPLVSSASMASALQFKDRVAGTAGVVSYLAVGVLYFGSGLVVPELVVYPLWAIWVLGLVATIRLAARRPWWSLLTPPAALVFWVGFVQTGSWLFGWTA